MTDDRPTIIAACNRLGIPYPVSAAGLHRTYLAFRRAGITPNVVESRCWRGTCDCSRLYRADHPGLADVEADHAEVQGPLAVARLKLAWRAGERTGR